MIGSVDRKAVREYFDLPERFDILLAIAFGYPKETVVIEKISDGDIKYYRDENQVLHVPKRKLKDIIHINKY